MTLDLPELAEIKKSLEEIKKKLEDPAKLKKAWYTAEECWELKGGCALTTFRSKNKYQCKGGIPDAYVGGRKVWSRESVAEWLLITDEKIPEYLKAVSNGR